MADPRVEDWYAGLSGPARALAMALRDRIVERHPSLKIALAWGFPCWSGNERIFSVIAHKTRINLQLWSGARLAERFPDRIEGTGKALRHVKVHSAADIDDELDAIIDAAVTLDATDPERVP